MTADLTAPSEAITQPSVEPDRGAIRALWKKHGGSWHGPRVETYTIPETSGFWPFIRELLALSPSTEVERLTREVETLETRLVTAYRVKAEMNDLANWERQQRLAAEATNRSLEERLAEAEAERGEAQNLVRVTNDAIAEYIRYLDGGETRGSYDGKPERNGLRKAHYAARAFLTKLKEGQSNG